LATDAAAPEGATARLGPLVRRSVHHGALLWLVGAFQFLLVMIAVQLAWTQPYSLSSNAISDLGNTGCGPWPDATSAVVCSPWHTVFNVSIIVLGLCVVFGSILVKSAFPPRKSALVGLGLFVLSGIGSIGVGAFPENVNLTAHTLSATLALGVGGVTLIVLAYAMLRDTRWNGYRAYTLLSGLVSTVAFLLLATHHYLGLGFGGIERLVAAPELLWLLLASIHLLYVPAFAPKAVPHA
jgi:hypothetical membrane protein